MPAQTSRRTRVYASILRALGVLGLMLATGMACGLTVRDGGRRTMEISTNKLGVPTSTRALRCPSDNGEGKIDMAWSSGHSRIKGRCRGGVMVGTWKAWHEFGRKQWKVSLVGGKIDGTYRSYHSNGDKLAKVPVKEGVVHGKFRGWWANGELRAKGKFVQGRRNGCWVTYYKNGQKASKGTYADGRKVLTWLSWTPSGQRTKEKLGGSALHGKCFWTL